MPDISGTVDDVERLAPSAALGRDRDQAIARALDDVVSAGAGRAKLLFRLFLFFWFGNLRDRRNVKLVDGSLLLPD